MPQELREEVQARTLSFDAAVDEFLRCATVTPRNAHNAC